MKIENSKVAKDHNTKSSKFMIALESDNSFK